MPPSPSSPGYQGNQQSKDSASGFNATAFLVRSILAGTATATLVRVMGVTNDGGVSPVGEVDLLPLVNQVDGAGNSQEHATVFGCPYSRLQGGANAVIIDPKVGDLGIAVFASRDLSSVIATKGQANPGSKRQFSMADGLYVGGVLNGTPTQYVQFSDAGITIHSLTEVKLEAPSVVIECQRLEVNASASVEINAPAGATIDSPIVSCSENVSVGNGASGTFVSATGQTIVVQDGIVINIF